MSVDLNTLHASISVRACTCVCFLCVACVCFVCPYCVYSVCILRVLYVCVYVCIVCVVYCVYVYGVCVYAFDTLKRHYEQYLITPNTTISSPMPLENTTSFNATFPPSYNESLTSPSYSPFSPPCSMTPPIFQDPNTLLSELVGKQTPMGFIVLYVWWSWLCSVCVCACFAHVVQTPIHFLEVFLQDTTV